MKHIESIISILVAALGLAGCDWQGPTSPTAHVVGSGVVVTDTRPIGEIRAVSISGAGRLIVDPNGPETLEITAEDNILPWLKAEVADGRLVVGPGPGSNFQTTRGVVYRIGARALREMEASGASRIESAAIDVDRLVVQLSGASSVQLAGAVSDLELKASGSSVAALDALSSPDVRVEVSGASRARVRASSRLTVFASGVSVVEYFGDPVLLATVSGNSVVQRIGP